jgi:hypothetical protein
MMELLYIYRLCTNIVQFSDQAIYPKLKLNKALKIVYDKRSLRCPLIIIKTENTHKITIDTQEDTMVESREYPVLDKVETYEHRNIYKQPIIHEKHKQDVIEVHEKPVEKHIHHTARNTYLTDDPVYQEEGRYRADEEKDRFFKEMQRQKPVKVESRSDTHVHKHDPIKKVENKELHKERIDRPIVTEIHDQPINEYHERHINKTVYDKPKVEVLRDSKKHIEDVYTDQPGPSAHDILFPPGTYDYKEDVRDIDKHWKEERLSSFPQRKHFETGARTQEELEFAKHNPYVASLAHHHKADPVETTPYEDI